LNLLLSISAGYAIHALHYIATRSSGSPVMTREIADCYDLPYDSTLKILRHLSKAGLVRPHRGCQGGFSLIQPPEEISLLEVLEAVDGPVTHGLGMPDGSGDRELRSRTEEFIREAVLELRQKLGNLTVADLVLSKQNSFDSGINQDEQ
jgi:Rrf2 family protein